MVINPFGSLVAFPRPLRVIVESLYRRSRELQKCKGTASQNITYCKKENDYKEWGTPTKSGQRNDLEEVSKAIKNGKSITEVANEWPETFIRYHRGIRELKTVLNESEKRDKKTCLMVITGETGIGKSKLAAKISKDIYPNSTYYKPRGEWWDGYEQQKMMSFEFVSLLLYFFFFYFIN